MRGVIIIAALLCLAAVAYSRPSPLLAQLCELYTIIIICMIKISIVYRYN